MDYTIDGYLTEQKLKDLVVFIADNYEDYRLLDDNELKFGRYKFDMGIEYRSISYFIEFDGSHHYSDINTIRRDVTKDTLVKMENNKVIRIPYFIQLTNETFKHFFNDFDININIIQDYKHGFIDNKAMLPSSWCELGIKGFIIQIPKLPADVVTDILLSLHEKLEKEEVCKHYIAPNEILEIIPTIFEVML